MKVYGIAEIARALGEDPRLVGKWRERHKLPAPDAELAVGPVWLAETIEPLIAAGGPEPRPPGGRLARHAVTARMTVGPYPPVSQAHRAAFDAAIAATHRTGYLRPPVVHWENPGQARVVLECEAPDPSVAEETVKTIIRRNAEFVAQFGVREIQVTEVTLADRSG